MSKLSERIIELNENYNSLGEDLVLLEALVDASGRENVFPEDCVETAAYRMADYVEQHTETIEKLAKSIIEKPAVPNATPSQAPSCRVGRQLVEHRTR